ncbi:extracellular solute-binding protein [Jatrophihabitans sp. GAS493]|uniref:extracellular solute-binding protein n=1 Tax=Jatrophihabitans sp. GAS493 TaxID=1907575 RepID=UPI001A7E1401|nr:extracellular solute-binding protein [Jatrophihabitans sp. GAS493]
MTLHLTGADYGSGQSNTTQTYWQNIATAFHKQNPKITVDVDTINWTDYDTKVKTQLQNHNYPDILQGEFFPQYATDGLTMPVSEIVSNPNMGIATFKSGFSVNGAQYALPFTTSARALFYNKKAFADAGLATAPTTWAEVESDAKALKAKGYTGFALPLGPEEAQAESYLWMLGNGGGWQDASGHYVINSSENIATFQFLKELTKDGLTVPNPATYNRTADSAADFAAGKVGMEFNGPFLTQTIAAAKKLSTDDYATAAIPGRTGQVFKTLGVADAIQAFKTSDATKKAAIKSFLDFALNDANQLAFAKEYALLPGSQSAADTLDSDPVLGTFVKTLPNTVQFPSSANWTATVLPAVKQNIGTAVTGDPAKVLGDLQHTATSGS